MSVETKKPAKGGFFIALFAFAFRAAWILVTVGTAFVTTARAVGFEDANFATVRSTSAATSADQCQGDDNRQNHSPHCFLLDLGLK